MKTWYEALPMLHLDMCNRYESGSAVTTSQVMTLVRAQDGTSIIP